MLYQLSYSRAGEHGTTLILQAQAGTTMHSGPPLQTGAVG